MPDAGADRLRVVIAGGGVAALEGLLALNHMAPCRVDVALVAPLDEFAYRPLSVGEPFESMAARRFSLWDIARDQGASFHRTRMEAIDPDGRVIRTSAGTELPYDALLIAIGAQQAEAVPGALTFGGSGDVSRMRNVLDEAESGVIDRIVFTLSDETWWPLAAYELALLTSSHLSKRPGAAEVSVQLVTPEARPLGLFGAGASRSVSRLLEQAGVTVHAGRVPERFENGVLTTKEGSGVPADRVIALPIATVPPIPGLPEQGRRGLIPTDRFGGVDGLPRTYAAGDATWFPIKQGGLAAQQADSAASAIAALAGAPVAPTAFHPVLRGALLTGSGPRYLRADRLGRVPSQISKSILWWPPSKVAGRFLAPYLFTRSGYAVRGRPELSDLEVPTGDDAAEVTEVHADVRELALSSAELEAAAHRYSRALRWLEVAEDLELALPPEYERKRVAWLELAGPATDQPPLPSPA
jgi:sulfide:quinone oxidoreductase